MILLYSVAGLLLGLIIGHIIGLLAGRSKQNELLTRIGVAETNRHNAEQRLHDESTRLQQVLEQQQEHSMQDLERQRRQLEAQAAEVLRVKEAAWQEALQTQKGTFDETMQRLTAQMENATREMLRARQEEFARSSNESLSQILTPLRQSIADMRHAIGDNTLKQGELGAAMQANIEQMIRQSEAARRSADELTRVFKHGSKVQGDWGETVLKELLDTQGLTEGVHYYTQAVIRDERGNVVKTDEGLSMRPDVILHLDKRREVIIDSKVSLTAFIDYVNAESDDARALALKAHVESLKRHVRELAAKDYASYIRPPKVRTDYVILFVPHSGALLAALNEEPDLWRRAMEKNVYMADEQTLYAALRIVALTWQQITQAQNHEQVYALANEMIDRVGLFVKSYDDLGRKLEQLQKSYEQGARKLEPRGQSITQTCGKLIKLGAKQSSKNPIASLNDLNDFDDLPEALPETDDDSAS